MEPAEKAAREILALIAATYRPTHEYVAADARRFGHLDMRFYERTTRLLGSNGFRTLADIEDRTITNSPNGVLMPVLVRTMLSRDGTVLAGLYHPRISRILLRVLLWLFRKLPGKVIDMETEFSDGSFVVTSNATSAAAIDLPATLISAEFLAASVTALAVFHRHAARVAAHLIARPGVTARAVSTLDELVASQNRMNAIKAAYRGEIGAVTKAELERLSMFGTSVAGDVHAAVMREQLKRAG
ncbi:MAG: hypothetical protein H7099_06355 [Gemmatimonadaceae bacterium]|nr:hypothetical protein [Gemmatimonadaceae bacterium]